MLNFFIWGFLQIRANKWEEIASSFCCRMLYGYSNNMESLVSDPRSYRYIQEGFVYLLNVFLDSRRQVLWWEICAYRPHVNATRTRVKSNRWRAWSRLPRICQTLIAQKYTSNFSIHTVRCSLYIITKINYQVFTYNSLIYICSKM